MPRTRRGDWQTLRTLVPYLWEYKGRVVAALCCLVAAKVANVGVPVLMKRIVDSLDPRMAMLRGAPGAARRLRPAALSTTVFTELREFLFAKVTQRAVRKIALQVFRHLHALSLRFHLARQTGGLTRDVERGQRGISTLISFALFSILPTLVEITLVTGILLVRYDWTFVAITAGALGLYITFTVLVTEWRTHFRREMNELDSKANTRAIDSLHQLRDGEVLRQRRVGGRTLRPEPAAVGESRGEEPDVAVRAQHRAELDHRRRRHADHVARDRRRRRGHDDHRRSGAWSTRS